MASGALYAGVPSSLRRRLHRRIGEVLELLQTGRPLVAAELARHFLAAGDAPRAVGYALQAGREASARYAHAEAARSYQSAIDLLLERGEQAQTADPFRSEGQFTISSRTAPQSEKRQVRGRFQRSEVPRW